MGNICLQPFHDRRIDMQVEDEEIENMQDPGEMLYLRQSLDMSISAQHNMRTRALPNQYPGTIDDASYSELESFAPHPIRPMSSASNHTRFSLPSSSSTATNSSGGLFFATLMAAVPSSIPSRRSSTESSPTLRSSSVSVQRSLFLSTGEKGPLILPRTSSLTTLVLDMRCVVDGILNHLSYSQVQKLSRVSKLWREAAAPILSKQTVMVTLGFDWGGREWSVAAFPLTEYVQDDFPSCPPTSVSSLLEFDSDEDDDYENVRFFGGKTRAAYSFAPVKASARITVYRPVTFNMEDSAPGPFPATSSEINQIRITPFTAAPARVFNLDRGEASLLGASKPAAVSSSSSSPDFASSFGRSFNGSAISPFMSAGVFSDSVDTLADEDIDLTEPINTSAATSADADVPAERCVRGRIPARDYNAFMDTIVGTSFCLVFNPSRSNFETLAVVSKGVKEGVELVEGFGSGKGKDVVEDVQICSEARLNQLRRYMKEIGGSQTILDAVINSVAMKRYLSCAEEERVWAFRYVIETLLEPSDPERGHHELNDTINRLDKIAHRVEILSQVGIPGAQRIDRLRSYYAEGCRAWRSILGGDLALRVGGYLGSLTNEDAVYKFLSAVLLPSFT